jgi:prepilin-type N-terminal cleavage/methylation domain-containing protein/prepilin-type processing-associated H-X9-DG protein
MEKLSRCRGFTLIELLVVVAVIGALIAILVPSLSAARRSAYTVKCGTNIRTLAQMDFQYGNEYGVLSRNSGGDYPSVFRLLAEMNRIPLVRQPWTGTPPPANAFESDLAVAYSKIKWLNCPAFPRSPQPVSFVVNGFEPGKEGSDSIYYMSPKRIFRPAEMANFAEANRFMPEADFAVYDVWAREHVTPDNNGPTIVAQGSKSGRILDKGDRRHGDKINLSFYDGHVEAKRTKDVGLKNFY